MYEPTGSLRPAYSIQSRYVRDTERLYEPSLGYTYQMRRFVILLLLWVLPIQFGLAATVDALQHAPDGHSEFAHGHSHAVVIDDVSTNVDHDNDADASAKSHGECGACHHCVHSVPVLATSTDFKRFTNAAIVNPNEHDERYRNAATERPERPNWSALV